MSSYPTARKFLYQPLLPLPDITDLNTKTIEVRIHKSFLTKYNKAVQQRHFFGNDFYSSDSDIVCILQHQNVLNLTDREPTEYQGISAFFKVSKPKGNYPTVFKNGIKSQKKKSNFEGNSIKYEGREFLQDFGTDDELK